MGKLDCCISLSCDRTDSELPKPTSPKVGRSPTETAALAEDMTRKSKLGVGEKNWSGNSLPSPSYPTSPERPALDILRSCLVPGPSFPGGAARLSLDTLGQN